MESIMMENHRSIVQENATLCLKNSEYMIFQGIFTKVTIGGLTLSVLNVTLAVISMFVVYFLTCKTFRGKQGVSDNGKKSHKHQRDNDGVDDYPLNEDEVSLLSMLTYSWVEHLLERGSSTVSLSTKDLFTLPNSLNIKKVHQQFCKTLKGAEESNAHGEVKKPTLLQGLYKAYGLHFFLLCGSLELLAHLIDFTGPITLNSLISFFENDDEPAYVGYRYSFLLFLSCFGKTLVDCRFHFVRVHVILKVRISIMTTIFKKALQINTVSLSKFSTGEIVNFLGTDTNRILQMLSCFHALWSLPIETILSMYILYQLVGLAFLGGLVVALILIPINKVMSTKQIALGKELMTQKDKRTKIMSELIGGIKTIKLYTWEDHFKVVIDKLRDAELRTIRKRKMISAVGSFLLLSSPILMTALTFSIYSLMGNVLTAAKLFTSLSLFLKLFGSLNDLPWHFNTVMQAAISLERLERFVALEDIDFSEYYQHKHASRNNKSVISANAGQFTWEDETKPKANESEHSGKLFEATSESGTLTLRDINFRILKGQFIGVIGKVGSGKSSLLNAILAEMARKEGEISVSNLEKGFALVGQEPWIQQATVRDNITFGKPFNQRKYTEVMHAASLKKDISILPAGDQTEVGENGVTLSGGQKARLALARALYQDKDVYLLDDPLAAVDAHVAQHVYDKCIVGLLKTKTRILCTHHTKFLGKADLVILMDDGVISKMGPPSDILPDIKFAEHKPSNKNKLDLGEIGNTDNDGTLGEETKATGKVKLLVYKTYLAALDKWLAPAILVSFVLMQAFEKLKSWWLTKWVSNMTFENNNTFISGHRCFHDNMSTPKSFYQEYDATGHITLNQTSLGFYMMVYLCLACVYAISSLAREILIVYAGMSVAKTIHSDLLNTILKAPMSFYDVTPVGRILNRFSSDMDTIDEPISNMVKVVLSQLSGVVAGIAVACYGMPWFILLILPVSMIYYQIQERYRHTSREVRRLTSLNRSPIFSHFSETVSGAVTIRAFRETERFKTQHMDRVEKWLRAHYTAHNMNIWLLLRTQVVGIFMVTGISILALLEHSIFRIDPGLAGLAISYTLTLSGRLNRVVTCVTEVEKQMVSVERVHQYIESTSSEKWKGLQPSPSWPATGVITYNDVYMKYRDGLPLVLKGLTFSTHHAEKVGIVGRTGSGKSSLFQTLFRTVEISSGVITIDGENVQKLDLKDVRRHLAVIPQDPFLFSGTVRENLDPTSCYSDEELWGVLDRCHLRLPVDRLGGLEGEVGEKGRHFSVGQKQLMCLARALLEKSKVLCIDEATASVDLETDKLIQETIRQEFVESTVLTIAHRINTIMDSDRVLVMDQGQVAELDSPEKLLKNPESAFYKLVHGENI